MIALANIDTYLQKILDAVYGEEVRGSIHDALAAMNTESSSAMEFAKTAKDSAANSAAAAKASETAAGEKATAASASAAAAKGSEDNAKASETTATQKAAEATTAAAGAKSSEEAAASSEAIAKQKASDAGASADAAALSESNVAAAEERVKSVKSEAETLAAQIAADKAAADAAKTDAEAARDEAVSSKDAAKGSADTALEAQEAAETARDEAQSAQRNADASARDAQTSKEDAEAALKSTETARDEAAKSASSAAKSAESAKAYSGKPPKIQNGTWWIWDADAGEYYDTHLTSEIPGPIGVGIEDFTLTSGNHAPGTSDVYTVTLTDGTEYMISVYNGRNGEGAGDVLGKSFDLVIPKDGWVDGQATIADERLMALATHKYLIDADASCRDEYDDCHVRAKDITESGFITFLNDTDPQEDLKVNVLRFELSANG